MWIVSGVRFPRQKRSCPSYSTGSRQNLRNVDFFLTFKMGFVLILTSNFKHSTCDHLDRFANPTTIPKHSEIYLTFRKVLSWSWLLAWVQVSLFFPNLLLGNSGLIVLFLFLSMIITFGLQHQSLISGTLTIADFIVWQWWRLLLGALAATIAGESPILKGIAVSFPIKTVLLKAFPHFELIYKSV